MDDRQSDDCIVLMKESNYSGGKAVMQSDIKKHRLYTGIGENYGNETGENIRNFNKETKY